METQEKLDFSDDFSDEDKISRDFVKFEEEGDFILGILTEIKPADTDNTDGKGFNYVLKVKEGEEIKEKIVGSYSALTSQINKAMIGKKIKITYTGEKKSEKTKRMYKNFDVFCKK